MRNDCTNRRRFLRQGGCGLLTLAALGFGDALMPLPVTFVDAIVSAAERRYPVPAGDGVSIDRGAQIILVRYTGMVYAMALACPHENAAVKWLNKDGRFQCTKHDSKYTPDGTYIAGRATRNLDRFPIHIEGAEVVITTDRVFRSDQDAAGWTAAAAAV